MFFSYGTLCRTGLSLVQPAHDHSHLGNLRWMDFQARQHYDHYAVQIQGQSSADLDLQPSEAT